jgi:hypothetical protein
VLVVTSCDGTALKLWTGTPLAVVTHPADAAAVRALATASPADGLDPTACQLWVVLFKIIGHRSGTTPVKRQSRPPTCLRAEGRGLGAGGWGVKSNRLTDSRPFTLGAHIDTLRCHGVPRQVKSMAVLGLRRARRASAVPRQQRDRSRYLRRARRVVDLLRSLSSPRLLRRD